jgi:hypothetical protein
MLLPSSGWKDDVLSEIRFEFGSNVASEPSCLIRNTEYCYLRYTQNLIMAMCELIALLQAKCLP